MKATFVTLGALAIVEALIAMLWKPNDRKWYAQLIRTSRIVGGAVVVCVSLVML